ncbi:MAG: NAD(P)/FAD-dependent oxidoreductase [Chloroflexota bacterium]|nr:NAD(P)/FAD-dependent oxidoreductase [Chloroflexota bacterium]
MAERADIAIVGAGVVGLAVGARLADGRRDIYVLEKNETFGRETSGRHSGVIHAGIYYAEGSLKARLCVAGNRMLYQLCGAHGIGHARLGKLIVAGSDEEVGELRRLRELGERNGAEGLRLLSRREVKDLEPNVEAVAALLSPSTGIVDAEELMRWFVAKATRDGASIVYRAEVVGIERSSDGYNVVVGDGADAFSFSTRVLINCAGLQSDRVAGLAGIDVSEAGYRLHFCKGEYFSVGGGRRGLVSRLIYAVPPADGASVGIHIALDLDGRMRLGPGVRYVDSIDYTVDDRDKDLFYNSVKGFLPFIEYEDLEPEMAGIRPKLQEPGGEVRDFVIKEESDRGLPGLINLVGIESPGLTACTAIAEHVAGMVDDLS